MTDMTYKNLVREISSYIASPLVESIDRELVKTEFVKFQSLALGLGHSHERSFMTQSEPPSIDLEWTKQQVIDLVQSALNSLGGSPQDMFMEDYLYQLRFLITGQLRDQSKFPWNR